MSWYARIRPWGKKPSSPAGIIGTQEQSNAYETLWPYIELNLESFISPFAVPRVPDYIQTLDFLRHIGPSTPGYICLAQSTAVWSWRFVTSSRPRGGDQFVLEVWDSTAEYLYPEDYWEDYEVAE